MIRNPPANAGVTGSHTAEQLSPWATSTEPVLESLEPQQLSPRVSATEARTPSSLGSTREASTIRSPRTRAREQFSLTATREKSMQR